MDPLVIRICRLLCTYHEENKLASCYRLFPYFWYESCGQFSITFRFIQPPCLFIFTALTHFLALCGLALQATDFLSPPLQSKP